MCVLVSCWPRWLTRCADTPEEARSLKAYGEVPDGTRINEATVEGDDNLSEDEGGFTCVLS